MLHIDRLEIQQQLQARGVDPDHIKALHVKLQSGELDQASFMIPAEQLSAPLATDIVPYDLTAATIGIEALRQDQLLVFWLNGGAATRYFGKSTSKLAKGVTPVLDDMSYIELKLIDLLNITKRYQLDVHPAVVVMNSFVTDQETRAHFDQLLKKYPDLDPNRFHFIVQQARIPRFTKANELKQIDLFVDQTGRLSWAPCGHGDFVYLLQDYLRHTPIPHVQQMFFANIDNLAATIDPALLGQHLRSQRGRTVEVVKTLPNDQGGVLCRVNQRLMIVEQMKLPKPFDSQTFSWLNTNTFWFSIPSLLAFDQDLPWILAEKTITEGDVIQLEHFACDVNVPSQYIAVARQDRFWPVKRYADLKRYQTKTDFRTWLKKRFLLQF